MNKNNEPTVFIVKGSDVPALFKELGLICSVGSDFFGADQAEVTEVNIREEYAELLADQMFLQACRIVAEPDLYVRIRNSGVRGLTESRLHRKKAEGSLVVLTESGFEDDILITAFRSLNDFLDVFATEFVSPADTPAANYIPPTVSLDEFLFMLHAVDSYRRVSYTNMLNHVFIERPYVSVAEYANSMANSIKSVDVRWLLPSFLAVTPGVERYETDLKPDNLAALLNHSFFEQGKLLSGEDVLVFAEAGQVMGIEFFHSWLQSFGLEMNVLLKDGFRAAERLFIAPTMLTNHLVRLYAAEGGGAEVNHQAYTVETLLIKLREIFEKAFSEAVVFNAAGSEERPVQRQAVPEKPESKPKAPEPVKPKAPEPPKAKEAEQAKAEAPAEGPKFCPNCGAKVDSGSVFCGSCGTKLF